MPLPCKRDVDGAMEGRGWENSRLAEEINKAFNLAGDDLVTAEEVYEWRRFTHESRYGFTAAAFKVLNLTHLSPLKCGFRTRMKITK
jgi:hypothetical protein